jgi:hypothetical protein
MSMQPQPDPAPQRQRRSDLDGIDESDPRYRISSATTDACLSLFNGLRPPLQQQLLEQRKDRTRTLQGLLDGLGDESPPLNATRSLVLAIGGDTQVFIEGLDSKAEIVPFVAVELPLSPDAKRSLAELRLGIFFPLLPSYVMAPDGLLTSRGANPSRANALVAALRWMELMDRVSVYSPEILDLTISAIFGGGDTRPFAHITGKEVIEELFTRRLDSFDEAFASCERLGLEVSGIDVYRGIKAGAVSRNSATEPVFRHFENAREEPRACAPQLARVSELLSAIKFFFFRRHSLESAHAKNPETLPAVEGVEQGLRVLREFHVGEGSALGSLILELESVTRVLVHLRSASVVGGLEKIVGGALCRAFELSNSSLAELRALEPGPSWRELDRRAAFLKVLGHLESIEEHFVQAILEVKDVLFYSNLEQDHESFAEAISEAYFGTIQTLRCLRERIDQAFPGMLGFKDAPEVREPPKDLPS